MSKCQLCGEPMPAGEEMFKFHGYSGPCPRPPLPKKEPEEILPDGLRIPLRELQADTKALFARVAEDGSVAGLMADCLLEKLSQIETAAYHLVRPIPAPREDAGGLAEAEEALKAVNDLLTDDKFGYPARPGTIREKVRGALAALSRRSDRA